MYIRTYIYTHGGARPGDVFFSREVRRVGGLGRLSISMGDAGHIRGCRV